MSGQLSHLTFSKSNATIHQGRYIQDAKGNPEDGILTMSNDKAFATLHYTYDQLDRLTERSLGTSSKTLRNNLVYVAGSSSNATKLVSKYTNEGPTGVLHKWDYTYDNNGNITKMH